MAKKIAVIGMGQFGMAIAKTLSTKGAEVLAIDRNETVIEEVAEEVDMAVA
ncbi:MAG: TrkA-N domain, partial [Anaerophaga sp.]|nr:TrkA-N domain [Anaerophaga sp.]